MAILSNPMAVSLGTLQPLRQRLVILTGFLDLYHQRTAFVT